MADFACLFEEEDGSFCMETVAVAGQHCARHTRVVEVPVMEIPAIVVRREVPDEIRCVAIMKNGQRCSHPCKGRTTRCGTHKDWTPLVQCAALVGRGGRRHQCTNNTRFGRTMCGVHSSKEPAAPAPPPPPAVPGLLARIVAFVNPAPVAVPVADVPTCRAVVGNGRRRGQECGRTNRLIEIPAGVGAQPEHCCVHHIATRKRELCRQWRALDAESIHAVHAEAAALNPNLAVDLRLVQGIVNVMDWNVPMTVYSADPAQARTESMRRARAAILLWAEGILRRPRVAAPPRSELERFTRDAQNVHTPAANAVVANANALAEGVEAISGSLAQIKARFVARDFGTPVLRKDVHKDMSRWYSDAKVMRAVGQMENNDFGYQRLLDKVWGLIQKSVHKDDLEKRLWEEAVDSLGMCTQGHMTRLANVLQGFDVLEAPKVEIPKGERLQTAMAQIAEMDIGERESAARRVFAELEIPEERQGSWLEALEIA